MGEFERYKGFFFDEIFELLIYHIIFLKYSPLFLIPTQVDVSKLPVALVGHHCHCGNYS